MEDSDRNGRTIEAFYEELMDEEFSDLTFTGPILPSHVLLIEHTSHVLLIDHPSRVLLIEHSSHVLLKEHPSHVLPKNHTSRTSFTCPTYRTYEAAWKCCHILPYLQPNYDIIVGVVALLKLY